MILLLQYNHIRDCVRSLNALNLQMTERVNNSVTEEDREDSSALVEGY